MTGVVFGSAGRPFSPWQAAQACASACTSAPLAAPVQKIPKAGKTLTNRRLDMAAPPNAHGSGPKHDDNAVKIGGAQGSHGRSGPCAAHYGTVPTGDEWEEAQLLRPEIHRVDRRHPLVDFVLHEPGEFGRR